MDGRPVQGMKWAMLVKWSTTIKTVVNLLDSSNSIMMSTAAAAQRWGVQELKEISGLVHDVLAGAQTL